MSFFDRARLVQTGVALAAALLVAGAATPLQAAAVPGTANTSAQTSEPRQNNAQASSERRICVRMALSNTRIERRVCKTQAEWDREGGVPQSE